MSTILLAIVPILCIIALGYCFRRFNVFNDGFLDGLSRLTFTIFIPCLLFTSIYNSDDLSAISSNLLLSFYIPVIGWYVLSYVYFRVVFKASFRKTELLSLAATFSNNVLIGIPVLLTLIGDSVLLPGFVIVSIHSLILFTLTSLFAENQEADKKWYRSLATSIWITTRSPIVISLLLGLSAKLLELPLHSIVQHTLDYLKGAALPCALIVLGATLARYKSTHQLPLSISVNTIKLLLLPLAVYCCGQYWFDLSPTLIAVTVIMSASPVGINVFMFAAQDPKASPYLASAILSSTVVAIATIPAWIYFLGLTP